jgi:hypothetical protein
MSQWNYKIWKFGGDKNSAWEGLLHSLDVSSDQRDITRCMGMFSISRRCFIRSERHNTLGGNGLCIHEMLFHQIRETYITRCKGMFTVSCSCCAGSTVVALFHIFIWPECRGVVKFYKSPRPESDRSINKCSWQTTSLSDRIITGFSKYKTEFQAFNLIRISQNASKKKRTFGSEWKLKRCDSHQQYQNFYSSFVLSSLSLSIFIPFVFCLFDPLKPSGYYMYHPL